MKLHVAAVDGYALRWRIGRLLPVEPRAFNSEYEDLKKESLLSFGAEDLGSLGELITKARIARGLTQAELGEILGMSQQQVQRYERDAWQKISLWRLAEAADALRLNVNIRARLPASSTARPSRIS